LLLDLKTVKSASIYVFMVYGFLLRIKKAIVLIAL